MTKTQLGHLFGHQLDHLAQKLQLQHLQASRTCSGKNGDRGVYIIYRDIVSAKNTASCAALTKVILVPSDAP